MPPKIFVHFAFAIFINASFVLLPMWAEETSPSLRVYESVTGLAPSEHYEFRVRLAGTKQWQPSFAFVTTCKQGTDGENAYFPHLSGWTHTYTNFEMSEGAVEVAIARVDRRPIRKAAVHPKRKAACRVRKGVVYLTIEDPCLIAVDIDGQMDDQNTGKTRSGIYSGPPIHALSIFANPMIQGRPDPNAQNVRTVKPGETPPSEGDWKTLYFLPGVHDIGVGFPVRANRNYYIPGDAIVYGTLCNLEDWDKGHHIRIFSSGTLSGARVSHPKYSKPQPAEHRSHDPIFIKGATSTSVEGITIADAAHHSLMLVSGYDPDHPTSVRWTKILNWRANGDGINPFANGLIEDCFIRTQDDAMYVNGRGIRRVVVWNDANGSAFVLSAIPDRDLVVEDCDVIYARAIWHHWSGGRLFNMRGAGKGAGGEGVVFRNIRVSDPRPTLQHFMIAMQGLKPYSDPASRNRGPGDLAGVVFKNIEIAAPSILGLPEVLWGTPTAGIKNITFENVQIGGKQFKSLDQFKHNEHVKEITFR